MSQPPLMLSVAPVMYDECVGGEEDDRRGDLLGCREPPERHLVDEALEHVGREVVADHGRVDETRCDGIDPDSGCRIRPRQPARHRHDPALRRVVDDRAAEAACPPALRAEVDDRSCAAGGPQELREGAVEEEGRLQVHVGLGVPVGLVDLADVVAAMQHGGEVDERDERADGVRPPPARARRGGSRRRCRRPGRRGRRPGGRQRASAPPPRRDRGPPPARRSRRAPARRPRRCLRPRR